MPRPRKDLDSYKDEIVKWVTQDGVKQSEVIDRLKEAGLPISRGTLSRRLQLWEVSVQPKVKDSAELRDQITAAFHSTGLTDKETLTALNRNGLQVPHGALVRLRKKMGLHKQIRADRRDEMEEKIREILQHELSQSEKDGVKRKGLHKYIRAKYNLVGR